MKITMKQVIAGHRALEEFSKIKMTPQVAFRIGAVLAQIRNLVDDYSQRRIDFIEAHGDPNPEGGHQIPESDAERMKAFTDFLDGIQKEEVEIDASAISVGEIITSKGETPDISPFVISHLGWLLKG